MKSQIQKTLLLMGEESYRGFSSKLMPSVPENTVIGVRIPKLRKYAKILENYSEFLHALPHDYFEENNLHAFLIEREKNFDKCIELLDEFLPFVDNWATCDSLKPPVLKTKPEKLLVHIKRWILSDKPFTVRYAINLLMNYYLDDNFEKSYPELVLAVESHEYYVNMMRAWYFATALAKHHEEILPYIENNLLDKWTHNKTIQKSIESHRINKEQKDYLRTIRQK